MLLQNYEQYEVVKSSGIGILQHDAFTWQIEDGKFVKAVDIEAKHAIKIRFRTIRSLRS